MGVKKGKHFDTKPQQRNRLNLCGLGYAGNPKGEAVSMAK